MRRIFKYELQMEDHQEISMPWKAELLHVGVQGDKVCLWALVETDNKMVDREIWLHGTGHPVNVPYDTEHLGTLILLDDTFVVHVFG